MRKHLLWALFALCGCSGGPLAGPSAFLGVWYTPQVTFTTSGSSRTQYFEFELKEGVDADLVMMAECYPKLKIDGGKAVLAESAPSCSSTFGADTTTTTWNDVSLELSGDGKTITATWRHTSESTGFSEATDASGTFEKIAKN